MVSSTLGGGVRLADALRGWVDADGPLYRRLADGIADAVRTGRLPAGTVLPPERQVAEALVVSRSTVVAAFDLCKAQGHLVARQGSGTWVPEQHRAPDEGNVALVEALEGHAIVRELSDAPPDTIEFTAAVLACAPEVTRASTAIDPRLLQRASAGHGYHPMGVEVLRERVAAHLTAMGLPSTPQQVLITTGATQATQLAARLYLEPGATALVETPTYAGAIDVLHAAGARLQGVDHDEHGVRTDLLADALARSLPRLVYLVPDFHNPTGRMLAAHRRRDVARLAASSHVPIVEDLVQRHLWLDSPPPPPIASYEPDAPILTTGSFSKVFWGGLRVGWIRASEATIARLARIKAVVDFGTPVVAQVLAAQLLPQLEDVAARRRDELAEGFAVLTAALAEHLPDWRWTAPHGGPSVWVQLPAPRADELARRATAHGVAVVPGTTFALGDQRYADRLRLPFVASPEVMVEGVRRLADAWSGLGAHRGRTQALVV